MLEKRLKKDYLNKDFYMNFNEALINEDFQKIMNKAASKFTHQLAPDEIHTCKLHALWKATESHEEGKCKFTTYLFNGVRQQCISAIKFNNRHSKKTIPLHGNMEDPKASGDVIDLFDEIDIITNGEMLKDRMRSNTIEEVAHKHNFNRETTRRKLKNATKILRERLL